MKQNDVAMIIFTVFFAGMFAFIIGHLVLSAANNRQQTVQVVTPITADFPTPDSDFYNSNSINPTVTITIGQGTSTNPFSGSDNGE